MKLTSSILVLVCSACWMQATQAQPTEGGSDLTTTQAVPECGGRGLGNLIPSIGEDGCLRNSKTDTDGAPVKWKPGCIER